MGFISEVAKGLSLEFFFSFLKKGGANSNYPLLMALNILASVVVR